MESEAFHKGAHAYAESNQVKLKKSGQNRYLGATNGGEPNRIDLIRSVLLNLIGVICGFPDYVSDDSIHDEEQDHDRVRPLLQDPSEGSGDEINYE